MKKEMFSKKIKEFFSKDARRIYMAAGIGCLVLAGAVLTGILSTSSMAESESINSVTYNIVKEGGVKYYIVDDASKMQALFNASEDETRGRHFRLTNDIIVSSITTASTGTFAGELDGQGYVLTINDVNIVSSGNKYTESFGILFGNVSSSGKVTDLIINLPNGGNVTRNSTIATCDAEEITETSTDGVDWNESEKTTKGNAVLGYLKTTDGNTDFVSASDVGRGKRYTSESEILADGYTKAYKQDYVITGTKTVTATLDNPEGYDSFGIVCGDNAGEISRVYVTGDDTFTVTGKSSSNPSDGTVYNATKTDTYYYEAEESTPAPASIELSSSTTSVSNDYVSGNLEIKKVPETGSGKTGMYRYVYILNLKNTNTNSSDTSYDNSILISDINTTTKAISDGSQLVWYLNSTYTNGNSTKYEVTDSSNYPDDGTNPKFSDIKYDDTNNGMLLGKGQSTQLYCVIENAELANLVPDVTVDIAATTITTVNFGATLQSSYNNGSTVSGTASVNLSSEYNFSNTSYSNAVAEGTDVSGYTAEVKLPNAANDGNGDVTAKLSIPAQSTNGNNDECVVSVSLTNKTSDTHTVFVSQDWTRNENGYTQDDTANNGYISITIAAGTSETLYKKFGNYRDAAENATISIKGWDVNQTDSVRADSSLKSTDTGTIQCYESSTATSSSEITADLYTVSNSYLTSTLYVPSVNMDSYKYTFTIKNTDTLHSYSFKLGNTVVNEKSYTWSPVGFTANADGSYTIDKATSADSPATLSFTIDVPENYITLAGCTDYNTLAPDISDIKLTGDSATASNYLSVSVPDTTSTEKVLGFYKWTLKNTSDSTITVNFNNVYNYDTSTGVITSIDDSTIAANSDLTVYTYTSDFSSNIKDVSNTEGTIADYSACLSYGKYSATIKPSNADDNYTLTFANDISVYYHDSATETDIKLDGTNDKTIDVNNGLTVWSYNSKIFDDVRQVIEYVHDNRQSLDIAQSNFSRCLELDKTQDYFSQEITGKAINIYYKDITLTMIDTKYNICIDLGTGTKADNTVSDNLGKTGSNGTPSDYTTGAWYVNDTNASFSEREVNGSTHLFVDIQAATSGSSTITLRYISTDETKVDNITSDDLSTVSYIEDQNYNNRLSAYHTGRVIDQNGDISKSSNASIKALYICKLLLKNNTGSNFPANGLSDWSWAADDAKNDNTVGTNPLWTNSSADTVLYKKYTGYSNAQNATASPNYTYTTFTENNYSLTSSNTITIDAGYKNTGSFDGKISAGSDTVSLIEYEYIRPYEKYVDTVTIDNTNGTRDVVITSFTEWEYNDTPVTGNVTVEAGTSVTFKKNIQKYENARAEQAIFSGYYIAVVTDSFNGLSVMSDGNAVSRSGNNETVSSSTDATGSGKKKIGLEVSAPEPTDKTDYQFDYQVLIANTGDSGLKDIAITTNDSTQSMWSAYSSTLVSSGIIIVNASFSDEEADVLSAGRQRIVNIEYTLDSVTTTIGAQIGNSENVDSKIDLSSKKNTTVLLSQGGYYLYAGGIAGYNEGSIKEIKYSLALKYTFANDKDGKNLGYAGNIVGNEAAGASLNNIYMTVSGSYAGNGISTDPKGSITSTEPVTSIKSGCTAWSDYVIANSSGSNRYYDLSWLIKKYDFDGAGTVADTTVFAADAINTGKQIKISIFTPSGVSGRVVTQGSIVYNARKALTDTSEDTLFYFRRGASDTELKIDLEDSAYYRVVDIYQTDGYYHYYYYAGDNADDVDTALGKAVYYFPYSTDRTYNPYSQAVLGTGFASVKRSTSTGNVQDMIEITMPSYNNKAFSGILYYLTTDDAESRAVPDSTYSLAVNSGKATVFYGGEDIIYRVTPYEESHIYPTVSTAEFTADSLEALPKPTVTYSGLFDNTGNLKEEQNLANDGSTVLFAGNKIRLAINSGTDDFISAYTVKYILSTESCSDISELDWSSASEYGGALEINDALVGTNEVYIYVQISKGSYNPSYYNCGSFNVAQSEITSDVYATLGAGAEKVEGSCLDGDVLKLGDGIYNGCDREYAFSSDEVTGYDELSWNTYSEDTTVLLDSTMPYLYMRLKTVNGDYSAVSEMTYTFGLQAGSISANPNAADETNPIQNGTSCLLTSSTNDADIYYLYAKTNSVSSAPSIERVQNIPDGVTSGDVTSDGCMYIKSGLRWYRITAEFEKYSSGVSLANDTNATTEYSLYAFSAAENYAPGEIKCFSFYVTKMDQVCVPEASLPTKCDIPGNTDEIATVSLGDTVSFTSATPSNGTNQVIYMYSTDRGNTWAEIPETGVEVTGRYGGEFIINVYATRTGMLDSDIVKFTYSIEEQGKVESLTSTPSTTDANPMEVIPGDRILLSSATAGVTIIYTTDETTPSYTVTYADDGSAQYELTGTTKMYSASSGIVMPAQSDAQGDYFTIQAVGIKDGLLDSDLCRFTFAYPSQVGVPYANVAAGNVSLDTDIYLYTTTDGATICYTIAYDENVPADPTMSSMVFTGQTPISITQKTTIKAIAFKDGVISNVVTLQYNPMTQLAAPSVSISSGSVVSNGMSLTLSSGNATIFYTLDGSDPTDSTNTAVVNGNNVTLSGKAGEMITVKAYASQSGYSSSETVTFTYQISESNGGITADIASGSDVSSGTKVNLMTDVTGASIYYVVGNGDPTATGILGNTVTITGGSGESIMVKAVAGYNGSFGTVTTFVYHILEKPSEPVASPSGGELTTAKYVILSSEEGEIYYTVDGSTPTTASTLYTEPFLINKTTTVKAITVLENGEISNVSTFNYVAAVKALAPDFSVEDNAVIDPGTVIYLTTDTEDALIYYTLDGSEPSTDNLENLSVYDPENGIQVSRSITIKAIAYRSNLQVSDISVCNIIVEAIPGQEIKQAQEEAEDATKLHASDASGLDRNSIEGDETAQLTLKEEVCDSTVSGSYGVLNKSMSIETEKLGEVSKTIKNNVAYYYGDDYSVLTLYDVYLVSNGTHVQPSSEVEIGLPIPEGYENASLAIVYVDENGKITPLETRRQDNRLYATVSHMSMYGIVGIESEKTSEFSFPMLLALETVAGLFVLGGVVFVCVKSIQKKRRAKHN